MWSIWWSHLILIWRARACVLAPFFVGQLQIPFPASKRGDGDRVVLSVCRSLSITLLYKPQENSPSPLPSPFRPSFLPFPSLPSLKVLDGVDGGHSFAHGFPSLRIKHRVSAVSRARGRKEGHTPGRRGDGAAAPFAFAPTAEGVNVDEVIREEIAAHLLE